MVTILSIYNKHRILTVYTVTILYKNTVTQNGSLLLALSFSQTLRQLTSTTDV